ncbi:TPA: hypothetical protein ACE6P7_002254, partial [Neisseria gonorrhoeae]
MILSLTNTAAADKPPTSKPTKNVGMNPKSSQTTASALQLFNRFAGSNKAVNVITDFNLNLRCLFLNLRHLNLNLRRVSLLLNRFGGFSVTAFIFPIPRMSALTLHTPIFLWQNIQMDSDLPSSNTIWQGTAAQEQQTVV